MLYLKLFLDVLIKGPVRSLGFLLSGASLCLMLGQSNNIQKNLMSSLPKIKDGRHFFALIDKGVNIEGVRRKLMELPGIKAVRNVSATKIQVELKNILGDVGVSLEEGISAPSVSAFKVFFSMELEIRSQKLIKKYLTRLIGEDKITIGPTLGSGKKINQWIRKISSSLRFKIGGVLLGLFVILYLAFGISLSSEIGKKAYLVERFSRRKNVPQATAAIGFLTAAFVMMLPSVILTDVNLIGLGLFLLLSVVLYIATVRRGWSAS